MTDAQHDPQRKYLVIDGPLQGNEMSNPHDYFHAVQINVPPLPPAGQPARDVPADVRVCYHLRAGADGELVWSCEAPK